MRYGQPGLRDESAPQNRLRFQESGGLHRSPKTGPESNPSPVLRARRRTSARQGGGDFAGDRDAVCRVLPAPLPLVFTRCSVAIRFWLRPDRKRRGAHSAPLPARQARLRLRCWPGPPRRHSNARAKLAPCVASKKKAKSDEFEVIARRARR